MPVRQLPEQVVNRIAAGEVVERPASVVKELVENAIDAGASRIDVFTDGGGRRRIGITDDGGGMTYADLSLAVDRHATSKLDDEDLLRIRTLGFRGEALPSIGAVAKLNIVTRHPSEPHAWSLSVERDGGVGEGLAAAPSLTRGNALGQFLFVNGRPVRDKLILGAVRAAYSDYLPRDRHPVVALFVTSEPQEVDANVHPAKTEVRFRNAGLVRALIVHALKDGLAREGRRTAANTDGAALSAFRPSFAPRPTNWDWRSSPAYPVNPAPSFGGSVASALAEADQAAFDVGAPTADVRFEAQPSADLLDRPLGAARTQIHETYIVSQTRDGLIVVDQHAAHERIVYEKLKASLAKNGVQRQILLIPEIVELDESTVEKLLDRAEELCSFGLAIESFVPGAVAVRETASLLGEADAA